MKKINSKDALVAQFKNYEIDKTNVFGGEVVVTGGSQVGGDSYLDQRSEVMGQQCDVHVSSHDPANWLSTIYEPTFLNPK